MISLPFSLMRTGAAAALACLAVQVQAGPTQPVKAEFNEQQRRFLRTYCVKCHDAETHEGSVRLDDIPVTIDSIETAERLQKILNQVNSGDMPPEDEPAPDAEAKTEFLDALSRAMMIARKALSDQHGRITMRRLNRREYRNTIQELFGVDVDVSELPADGEGAEFDTVGSGLFMSDDQFLKYRDLARRAAEEMIAAGSSPQGQPATVHVEPESEASDEVAKRVAYLEEWREDAEAQAKILLEALEKPGNEKLRENLRANTVVMSKGAGYIVRALRGPIMFGEIKGLPGKDDPGYRPLRFRMHPEIYESSYKYLVDYLALPEHETGVCLTRHHGPMTVTIKAPDDAPAGVYLLRMRLGALKGAASDRCFIDIGHPGPKPKYDPADFHWLATRHVAGDTAAPQVLEIPVTLTATKLGNTRFFHREFAIREKQTNWREGESVKAFNEYLAKHGFGPPPAVWIDWVELVGPVDKPAAARLQDILTAGADGDRESGHARSILERFAAKAFRGRPPEKAYVDGLVSFFEQRRAEGDSFEEALVEPLSIVLSSPSFLYLREGGADGAPRPISDLELASRLSYFFWGSPPDAELLDMAARGSLQDAAELARQVDRMLANEKIHDFIAPFAHQWLGMKRLDFFNFSSQLHPTFDTPTKESARREVYETLAHLIATDGSLPDLLKSDYVVVDALMASFYGLEGIKGDDYRKVSLPNGSPRGGLMGMAAVLAMGSNGEESSPVDRGAWVLRKLLNDPPPPAPANIPQLTRLADQLLTTRERLLTHREEPQCAQCHRKIDPIGFGMENFDAVGLWRTKDSYERVRNHPQLGRKEWEIDPSGTLHGGPSFKDYFELRDIVAATPERFARGFTEALIQYGLGRPVGFSDEQLIESIMQRAQRRNLAIREFIHALVESEDFRTK